MISSERKNRITSIDGLRGLSCLIIAFASHYWKFWISCFPFLEGKLHPELFVEVFVGISGFCMMYNYLEGINDNFFHFYGRKYFQIMPMLWISNLAMIIFDYFFSGKIWITRPILLSLWKQFSGLSSGLFTLDGHANGALWTIDLLLVCYVAFYFYIHMRNMGRKGRIFSDAVLAMILLVSWYGMIHWWNRPFLYYVMSLRVYASFIIGIIVYYIIFIRNMMINCLL